MSDMQIFSSPAVGSRVGRSLARIDAGVAFSTALVRAKAEVEAARLDAVGAVAGRALQDVAMLSQMEQSLAMTVPHASGRLATVADIAALSMAEVVRDAAHRIGR